MWAVTIRDADGHAGGSAQLGDGAFVTLGSDADNQLVIPDAAVSRRHACLEVIDGELWVASLGANKRVTVNGELISQPTRIDPGSQVTLGNYWLEVSPATQTAAPPEPPLDLDIHPVAPPAPEPAPEPEPEPELDIHPVAAPSPAATHSSTQVLASDAAQQLLAEAEKLSAQAPEPPGIETRTEPAPGSASGASDDAEDSQTAARAFEERVGKIRSYRDNVRSELEAKKHHFAQEWDRALVEMRALRDRLSGDARVLYFTISRDDREVNIKLQPDRSGRPLMFSMTRGHPDRPLAGEERVWIRDQDLRDQPFSDPERAVGELVNRIAGLLA